MVELEGKIPLDAYTGWIVEKNAIKAGKKIASLEDFVNFYTKLVEQHADAQYIRHQLEEVNKTTESHDGGRSNDRGKHPTGGRNKGRRKQGEEVNLLNTNTNDDSDGEADATTKPQKGTYRTAYCLYEKVFGHGTAFCRFLKKKNTDQV